MNDRCWPKAELSFGQTATNGERSISSLLRTLVHIHGVESRVPKSLILVPILVIYTLWARKAWVIKLLELLMVKHSQLVLAVCSLIGMAFSTVSAQQSDSSDAPIATPGTGFTEEIIVIGKESLSQLKFRIKENEEAIFSFFNANNSSNRMNIDCYQRKPVGSNIAKRVCEPKFLTDLRVEKTRDARMGIGVNFLERDLVSLSAQDFYQLQNEMLSLSAKHKEFSDALEALADLVASYDDQMNAIRNDN